MRQSRLISRRELLHLGAAVPALHWSPLSAQPLQRARELAEQPARFRMVKQISSAMYGAVSPDCGTLCIFQRKEYAEKIRLGFEHSQQTVTRGTGAPVDVTLLEMGSWREMSSTRLYGAVGEVSFFPSSNNLFGSYFTAVPATVHYFMIDRQTGTIQERQQSYASGDLADYNAFHDHTLIGIRGQRVLLQAHWPDLGEVRRVYAEGNAEMFHLR